MPSPFIHILFTLGYGTLFMYFTKGNFSALHCLVLTWNSFIGPDIGSFLRWSLIEVFPDIANIIMNWIHSSIGYILLVAPFMSIIFSKLSKIVIELIENNTNLKQMTFLSIWDCYLLSIAGCLFHFQIDHIFEENGRDKFYLWILSTGNFDDPHNILTVPSVFFVSLSTMFLVLGFSGIHLRYTKIPFIIKMKHTFLLFTVIIILYTIFLVISKYVLLYKAVVGEEADLGALVYIVIFHFLPILLCIKSINYD